MKSPQGIKCNLIIVVLLVIRHIIFFFKAEQFSSDSWCLFLVQNIVKLTDNNIISTAIIIILVSVIMLICVSLLTFDKFAMVTNQDSLCGQFFLLLAIW